ncbi:prolyl oligopeptidase family serine peptidase [Akkermansiaceae bacterium]|nr:prolyl oligopeptidase family serine peptidase [Akkermansiaceae bacterium]
MKDIFKTSHAILIACLFSLPAFADYASDRAAIAALGNLTSAPTIYEVDTSDTVYQSTETIATLTPSTTSQTLEGIFFGSVDYLGNATRVYALVGMPAWDPATDAPLPAIVLVHGGGGGAEETWANLWAERGYVAISIDTEGSSNTGGRHDKGGPRRTGVFNESDVTLGDQFMFHASAGSILANSLLRSLPFVDDSKVGIHGISWGGLITSTVIGVDGRFAFAIPSYGCGHMWDGLGKWQEAISDAGGTDYYKNVWDAMLWLENATMPIMWLSWPKENNFNVDCQANSYLKAPGTRMVSLIPGMRHSQIFTWRRADSYDFADSIVGNNSGSTGLSTHNPWCLEKSRSLVGDQIMVEFESTRTLTGASLIYTNEMGSTTFMDWPSVSVDSFAETSPGSGIWQVTATLPSDANGWFVNVTADTSISTTAYLPGETTYFSNTVYASSRLQEVVTVQPPSPVELALSDTTTSVTGNASVDFTAIHNLEITSLDFVNETHPGAFSTNEEFTFGLISGTPFQVTFDNSVAGLKLGESATATIRLTWVALDNVTTSTIEIPLSAIVDNSQAAIFTWDGGGSNLRWTVGDNWVNGTAPPTNSQTPHPEIIISTGEGSTTSNTYADYSLSSLTFDDSIDDSFTLNVFRASSFVRTLTFDAGGNNASLGVDAGSSGDILISDFDTAASLILNDNLDLAHNGTGTLTLDLATTEEIGETNGITKSGSGSVILQGTNNYTGDTIVEAGTFTLDASSSLSFIPTANGTSNQLTGVPSGTGTIHLNGEINLNLSTADSTLGNSWLLIDDTNFNVSYAPGTFSVNSSRGAFTNNSGVWTLDTGGQIWTFAQATGILEILGKPYDTWAASSFTLPFTSTSPTEDPDNDGLPNLLEFVLGGDPTISQNDIGLSVTESNSSLQITFRHSDVSKTSPAVGLIIETSEDLSFSTPANDIAIENTSNSGPIGALGASYTVSNNAGFDTITVTIPNDSMPISSQFFVRLSVSQ